MGASEEEAQRLLEKQAFHAAFAALDNDEVVIDEAHEASEAFFRRPDLKQHQTLSQQALRSVVRRSLSENDAVSTTALAVMIDGSSHSQPAGTTAGPPSQPPPSALPRGPGRAAKHNIKIKLLPGHQQIFKGLQLYFCPNNDIDLARRERIRKALEHGGSWQIDFNRFVTHVVVDHTIDHASVLSHLRLDKLPDGVELINEIWLTESISDRTLMRTDTARYKLRGAPTSTEEAVVSSEAEPPTAEKTSLQLKPAGKDVQAKPPSTPRSTPLQKLTQMSNQASSDDTSADAAAVPAADPTIGHFPVDFQLAIKQARQAAVLPIDDEEEAEEDDRPVSSGSASSDDDTTNKKRDWQDAFQCMQPHTDADTKNACPNAETIDQLQQMVEYYQQTADEWRIRAYRQAIAVLRKHPTRIVSRKDAIALPKIGPRLADKIEEIATTHRLRRLDNVRLEPIEQALKNYMKIYGVGHKQAMRWIQAGHRTIEDLLSKAQLTTNQRIGVEHYEDFNARIPREEVAKHGAVVEATLRSIDPEFEVIVGGSYRRGSATSGDIDCIITHPTRDLEQIRDASFDLLKTLKATGFLTAELAALDPKKGARWMGAACLPGHNVWRRMDLLLVPIDELGAAKIYFTGNDIFNRSIRLLADRKQMRLNQRGLYKDVIRTSTREKLTEGTLVEGRSEKKIFEILGVPWLEPHERII